MGSRMSPPSRRHTLLPPSGYKEAKAKNKVRRVPTTSLLSLTSSQLVDWACCTIIFFLNALQGEVSKLQSIIKTRQSYSKFLFIYYFLPHRKSQHGRLSSKRFGRANESKLPPILAGHTRDVPLRDATVEQRRTTEYPFHAGHAWNTPSADWTVSALHAISNWGYFFACLNRVFELS